MKQEIILSELGFFPETIAKKISEKLTGKTYIDFEIKYSNCASNCTIILVVDDKYTREEAKNMFYSSAFWLLGQN